MGTYYHAATGAIRQIDPAVFDAWVAAGNPKASGWALIADPPSPAHTWDGSAWVPPPLQAVKDARIAQINAECTGRILAVWPLEKQLSALAGIYGSAEMSAMAAWVDSHIAASNIASDAVDAATTIAAAEAVTVAWPD
jgi:hypothetical protein